MSKKKVMLSLCFSFMLMFLFSPTTLASENERDIEIDLTEATYVEVSEEEVIQDFMNGQGVDRETAKKELGISDFAIMSDGCTTSWRYYNTPKKLIDSGTKSYLTVHPYVQVKTNCKNNPTAEKFLKISSNVNYTLDTVMGGVHFDGGINAVLNGSSEISIACKGHIKNILGIKVRNWTFQHKILAKAGTGGGGIKF